MSVNLGVATERARLQAEALTAAADRFCQHRSLPWKQNQRGLRGAAAGDFPAGGFGSDSDDSFALSIDTVMGTRSVTGKDEAVSGAVAATADLQERYTLLEKKIKELENENFCLREELVKASAAEGSRSQRTPCGMCELNKAALADLRSKFTIITERLELERAQQAAEVSELQSKLAMFTAGDAAAGPDVPFALVSGGQADRSAVAADVPLAELRRQVHTSLAPPPSDGAGALVAREQPPLSMESPTVSSEPLWEPNSPATSMIFVRVSDTRDTAGARPHRSPQFGHREDDLLQPVQVDRLDTGSSDIHQRNTVRCPHDHVLYPVNVVSVALQKWICKGCQSSGQSSADVVRYRCAVCDYDLCEQCCTLAMSGKVSGTACPKGHVLQPVAAGVSRWICDGCQEDGESSSYMWRHRCTQCDYDLCERCHSKHDGVSELVLCGDASPSPPQLTIDSSQHVVGGAGVSSAYPVSMSVSHSVRGGAGNFEWPAVCNAVGVSQSADCVGSDTAPGSDGTSGARSFLPVATSSLDHAVRTCTENLPARPAPAARATEAASLQGCSGVKQRGRSVGESLQSNNAAMARRPPPSVDKSPQPHTNRAAKSWSPPPSHVHTDGQEGNARIAPGPASATPGVTTQTRDIKCLAAGGADWLPTSTRSDRVAKSWSPARTQKLRRPTRAHTQGGAIQSQPSWSPRRMHTERGRQRDGPSPKQAIRIQTVPAVAGDTSGLSQSDSATLRTNSSVQVPTRRMLRHGSSPDSATQSCSPPKNDDLVATQPTVQTGVVQPTIYVTGLRVHHAVPTQHRSGSSPSSTRRVLSPPRHAIGMSEHPVSRADGLMYSQRKSVSDSRLSCAESSVDSSVGVSKLCIPLTHEGCMQLHNMVAMPLMRQPRELGKAYLYFDHVNAMFMRIHGTVCVEAIYNQACCLSLAAAALFTGLHEDPMGLVSSLPRGSCCKAELAEARLEKAVVTLQKAVEGGYRDVTRMLADEDLKTVRDRRPAQFQALLRQANTHCAHAGA